MKFSRRTRRLFVSPWIFSSSYLRTLSYLIKPILTQQSKLSSITCTSLAYLKETIKLSFRFHWSRMFWSAQRAKALSTILLVSFSLIDLTTSVSMSYSRSTFTSSNASWKVKNQKLKPKLKQMNCLSKALVHVPKIRKCPRMQFWPLFHIFPLTYSIDQCLIRPTQNMKTRWRFVPKLQKLFRQTFLGAFLQTI